jgi:hypothetical protein
MKFWMQKYYLTSSLCRKNSNSNYLKLSVNNIQSRATIVALVPWQIFFICSHGLSRSDTINLKQFFQLPKIRKPEKQCKITSQNVNTEHHFYQPISDMIFCQESILLSYHRLIIKFEVFL